MTRAGRPAVVAATDLDDEFDALYAAPPDEFVATRDAAAKRLREAGDREAATEVKRARKPSAAAAVVNRLVRDEGKELDALWRAGDELAARQQELLDGKGDARKLRDAQRAEREALDALLERAGADGATRERVSDTLHAAAVDPDARAQVSTGRLVKELAHAGFGALTPAAPPPKPRKPKEERRAQERRRKQLAEAERAFTAASKAREKAQRAARRAAEKLAAAQQGRDEADAALGDARAEEAAAKARLDDLAKA